MHLVTGATARSNISKPYLETSRPSFRERRDCQILNMLYKVKSGLAPDYFNELLPKEKCEYIRYKLLNNNNVRVPATRH